MTARVSMVLKSRASPDMLPFSLCTKKRLAILHMNRLFISTTLSIPSYSIGNYVVHGLHVVIISVLRYSLNVSLARLK
jgi:hypothetical protein